jgi:uncharacterized protein (TIGR03083 family)
METWDMIDAERTEFADLCDSLTPEQWETQSLCGAWRVRDVVGHVTGGANLSAARAVLTLFKYGFRLGPMLEKTAIEAGSVPTPQLAAEIRATIGTRKTPPGVKPAGVLTDNVVHQQDVRRVVGVPRTIATDRLRIALDETKNASMSVLPGKKRIAGLHLRATDMDWETGDAGTPEITGTGEALLLAIAGRGVALGDLSGTGVETLRSRLSA